MIDSKIHPAQKCIAGRSMLENVLRIDTLMHYMSIAGFAKAAAIFFDFKAAFPSIAHQYLFEILQASGIPSTIIRIIKKLYHRNWHVIKLAGKTFVGPLILAGVRQGCPLSMILFALCLQPLIIKLGTLIGNGDGFGAFADDLALVVANLDEVAGPIAELFERFAKASGLHLNLNKCVIVPLSAADDAFDVIKASVANNAPAWSSFPTQDVAEYLGFKLGPGSVDVQWNSIIRKAQDTTLRWASLQSGFLYNILACNVFILSLFSFVGQLSVAGKEVESFIDFLIRKMFAGPGNWLPPDFLCHLNILGMPVSLKHLGNTIRASKIRVAFDHRQVIDEIGDDAAYAYLQFTNAYGHDHKFSKWHANTFVNNLSLAKRNFEIDCSSQEDLYGSILANKKDDFKVDQSKILKLLDDQMLHSDYTQFMKNLRKRLDRYKLRCTPRLAPEKVITRMKLVKGKVKHSLLVVYMRTILNGWVTERRMRSIIGKQSNSHDNKCVLCDSLYGEDSLEHIACCRCTKEIFAKLGIHIVDMHDFLALSVDYQDPKAMANHLMALGITYSIYNTVKHHDPNLPPIVISELITAGISSASYCMAR